ncbi:MAG TPA: hypothetical protein VMU16_00710 [Candidatus Binataceae bacterium]|nr:hypothetical protein [Candidatus Binataceae bacterium]
MILLFYAFAREIAPLRGRLKNRTALPHPGFHGFTARIGAKEFSAVGHGIGIHRARETAKRVLDLMPQPELIVGTGVAGALSAGLKPGDLVIADRIIAIESEGGPARAAVSTAGDHLIEIGGSLKRAGIAYSTGGLLTSHRVLATGAEKRRAKEITGAIAVDMEAAAIADEAAARSIPFAVIRAVLDEVDEEVFGSEIADEHGRVRPLAAASYLARNPRAAFKIPRLMRNISIATNSIADAIEAIAHQGKPPRP